MILNNLMDLSKYSGKSEVSSLDILEVQLLTVLNKPKELGEIIFPNRITFPQEQLEYLKKIISLNTIDKNILKMSLNIEDDSYHMKIKESNLQEFFFQNKQIVTCIVVPKVQFRRLSEFKSYLKENGFPREGYFSAHKYDKDMKIIQSSYAGVELKFCDRRIPCTTHIENNTLEIFNREYENSSTKDVPDPEENVLRSKPIQKIW